MGVFVVFLLLPPWAHALEVGLARLQDGEVRVMGKGAAKDASIYWQGVAVTTSTGGGSFNFTTSNVPVTCVGKLSDGVTTLFIAVSGCSASGVTIPSTVAPVAATGQTTMLRHWRRRLPSERRAVSRTRDSPTTWTER